MEEVVGTQFESTLALTLSKIILKPHAHLHIIGWKCTKCYMNLMKDGGAVETRFWTDQV